MNINENKTPNRNATCHVRVYEQNGLIFSANPRIDAEKFAHRILKLIREMKQGTQRVEDL